jgi:cellulose synthase/poly-beta-1,6-N-acetylglucosamine synthase-like glycosyltransferase
MAVRFSILMPVYNIQKYLRQTIDSLLSQNFRDFEVVIVDDGSTDQTPQILESYGARIRVCRQANTGAEFARNKAASRPFGPSTIAGGKIIDGRRFECSSELRRWWRSPCGEDS